MTGPGSSGRGGPAAVPLVEELLSRMTLAEKAGQMSQLPLFQDVTPSETLDAVRSGRVGSFLNARSLEQRNALQRVAVEESRLKIPLIFGRDVIHGYKTIFPIPLGQSATFDPDLVERAAEVAAREASDAGIDWVFAPMVDIARDPRWGRVAESCGEDPYLASRMGSAMVRGFQGDDPRAKGRVAACAKHYAGYGAAEAGREYNTTSIPEQLLREVYLAPFEACVQAGVLTLMSGFNDLNGVPATGNEAILRHILKGEWAFPGFVVSDWGSVVELVQHGFAGDEREAALAAARAGVDMEMGSGAFVGNLAGLVENGSLSVGVLDDAVRRVLGVKHRLGLFDRPYVDPPGGLDTRGESHRQVALDVARASIVLLKNAERVLPLSKGVKSLAVVGPQADDALDQLGCWAFDGDASAARTVLATLRQRLGGTAIHVAKGVDGCRSVSRDGFAGALEAASKAEVVLAFVGEPANLSGECRSRAFLDLPGVQLELLERLAETGRPLVVTIAAGRPLLVGKVCDLASAVLYAWHAGTMAGPAIVDVLFGDVSPSGKLPVSFPRAVGQIPIYYNAKNTGRPATVRSRGIPAGTPLDPAGFESAYVDVDLDPEFPFGFGLSYAHFEYSELSVTPGRAKLGETSIKVKAQVQNVGEVAGVETVQLYLRDRVGSITRPVRELKRFTRVSLGPRDRRAIEFVLTPDDLAFYGQQMRFGAEPGMFDVFVGGDSRAALSAAFELV